MPTPTWTRIVIALAASIWVLILLALGEPLNPSWARPLGLAASIVVLLLLAFDRWIWRWPLVRQIARRPVLHGTWKTELRTSYQERKDETIEAYLVVGQTYSQIRVSMLFDRSRSTSMSGDLVMEDGRCVLYYVFRSEKETLDRDGNPPSRGAAELTVGRAPFVHLEGDYWMEVGTRGRVRTVGHNSKVFDTYRAAQAATYG